MQKNIKQQKLSIREFFQKHLKKIILTDEVYNKQQFD